MARDLCVTFQVSYPVHANLLAPTSNASRRIFNLPSLLLKYHIPHIYISLMKNSTYQDVSCQHTTLSSMTNH